MCGWMYGRARGIPGLVRAVGAYLGNQGEWRGGDAFSGAAQEVEVLRSNSKQLEHISTGLPTPQLPRSNGTGSKSPFGAPVC